MKKAFVFGQLFGSFLIGAAVFGMLETTSSMGFRMAALEMMFGMGLLFLIFGEEAEK